MTEMTLYGLKSCDSCRKAKRELEEAVNDVQFVDLKAMGDLKERVPGWIDAVGAERLLNKRSTTWRELGETERAMTGSRTGLEALLIAHPSLIKRPLIEAGGVVHVGWNDEVRSVLGL